jgi:hypothetical protein
MIHKSRCLRTTPGYRTHHLSPFVDRSKKPHELQGRLGAHKPHQNSAAPVIKGRERKRIEMDNFVNFKLYYSITIKKILKNKA